MLPKTLYELLPYLYALAGILALVQLNHQLATASGLLLICAGLLVGYWRYTYRRLAPVTPKRR